MRSRSSGSMGPWKIDRVFQRGEASVVSVGARSRSRFRNDGRAERAVISFGRLVTTSRPTVDRIAPAHAATPRAWNF